MNKDQIVEWLETYKKTMFINLRYIIHDDLSVDVYGHIWLEEQNLTEIPFKFNIVNGDFNCSYNQLTSLKNCPTHVKYNLYCSNNQLTTLEGCTTQVDGNFSCFNTNIKSLQYCPKIIKGEFYCDDYLKNCKEYKVHQMMKMLRK